LKSVSFDPAVLKQIRALPRGERQLVGRAIQVLDVSRRSRFLEENPPLRGLRFRGVIHASRLASQAPDDVSYPSRGVGQILQQLLPVGC
jgi:hypothetical protein